MFYPFGIEQIFQYRFTKVTQLINNWVKKKRNIEKVKKPIDFRNIDKKIIPDLNRFMTYLMLYIAKDGENPIRIKTKKYNKNYFMVVNKKITTFLENHKLIIHSKDYCQEAIIEIMKIVRFLKRKKDVKKLYNK